MFGLDGYVMLIVAAQVMLACAAANLAGIYLACKSMMGD